MCDYVSRSVVTIIYSIRIDTKLLPDNTEGVHSGVRVQFFFAGACTNIALKSLLVNLKKKNFFFVVV